MMIFDDEMMLVTIGDANDNGDNENDTNDDGQPYQQLCVFY